MNGALGRTFEEPRATFRVLPGTHRGHEATQAQADRMPRESARKPDFFIVGAPRCGTTWLHRHLSIHPAVYMSRQKEPHYFNSDSRYRWIETLDEYESLFRDASPGAQAIGEASVLYLHSALAAANILRYQPLARFVAMARNPLEMAPSWHRQLLFDQQEEEPDFARAWASQGARAAGRHVPARCREPAVLQYRSICLLGEQIARLIGTAGRGRAHVILHDDLRRDPERVYRGVLEFLGLESWLPTQFAPVNPARERKSRLLKRVSDSAARVKQKLGIDRSFGALGRVDGWNTRLAPAPAIPPSLRTELIGAFADDVELLARMIGRPLDHWLT
jgi:hypothetical protein